MKADAFAESFNSYLGGGTENIINEINKELAA
jgi:hypothetical protein